MTNDIESCLTKEEIEKERTPEQLKLWVEKILEFTKNDKIKKQVLLHEGLFKQFYEEVHPLSLLVNKIYPSSPNIRCIPCIDNKDFDAIIRDYTFSPPHELKVEFTYVRKGVVSSSVKNSGHDEHIRMEQLIKHGSVNIFGSLYGDKRTGYYVEDEMIDHTDLLQKTFSLIKEAAENKSKIRKHGRYGKKTHVLVIVFADSSWFNACDKVSLEDFMKKEVLILDLNFKTVYILGASGKAFLSFELRE